jgi:hypothetical protein
MDILLGKNGAGTPSNALNVTLAQPADLTVIGVAEENPDKLLL